MFVAILVAIIVALSGCAQQSPIAPPVVPPVQTQAPAPADVCQSLQHQSLPPDYFQLSAAARQELYNQWMSEMMKHNCSFN